MTTQETLRRANGAAPVQNTRSADSAAPAAAQLAPAAETRIPAKFTIHGVLDGFPFDAEVTGTADLLAIVKRLKELGAIAPTPAAIAAAEIEDERQAPICKYHGPMKPSRYGGYHCTRKMGNGEYCTEKSP